MFDVEEFIAECQAALKEHSPQAAVRELLERAMSAPTDVEAALGTPTKADRGVLYHAPDLTILNVVWAPQQANWPHDHRLWAVIGIYGGQEDNSFYRRGEQQLVQAGGRELHVKDVLPLGEKAIHSVANPRRTFTAAIHVYGGDFFAQPRSEWNPETWEERPFDLERSARAFASANEQLRSGTSAS